MVSLEYLSRVEEGEEERRNLRVREELMSTLTEIYKCKEIIRASTKYERRGRPSSGVKRDRYSLRCMSSFLTEVNERLYHVFRRGKVGENFLSTKILQRTSEKLRFLLFLGFMKLKEMFPDPEQINYYLKKYVEMKERGEI